MLIREDLNNGKAQYRNHFTGKIVKLMKGSPIRGNRLPDFVFRYIQPGVTAIDREMGIPELSLKAKSGNKKGSKFTPSKKMRYRNKV